MILFWVAFGQHQITRQLIWHPGSVRSDEESSMAKYALHRCGRAGWAEDTVKEKWTVCWSWQDATAVYAMHSALPAGTSTAIYWSGVFNLLKFDHTPKKKFLILFLNVAWLVLSVAMSDALSRLSLDVSNAASQLSTDRRNRLINVIDSITRSAFMI